MLLKRIGTAPNLVKRHYNQIGRRHPRLAEKLQAIWAVTFITRGKTLVPAGSVSMMVLSSHANGKADNSYMELTCITSELEPQVGVVHFSNVRMSHDFSIRPRPGALGRVLDPRDPKDPSVQKEKGDRPNAEWVRVALEADRARVGAVEQNYRLDAVPTLPRVRVAFANTGCAAFVVTQALKEDMARHMGRTLSDVEAMEPEAFDIMAKAHWETLFTPPGVGNNTTGAYLIDHVYVANFSRAIRVYEDYSDLVGVNVHNVVSDISGSELINPAGLVAPFNIREMLTSLQAIDDVDIHLGMVDPENQFEQEVMEGLAAADGKVTKAAVEELEAKIMSVIPAMRRELGIIGKLFTDDELLNGACSPDFPLRVSKGAVARIADPADRLAVVREFIKLTKPYLNDYVTDEDLSSAIEQPAAPLFASRMPRIQVMRRDLRTSPENAMRLVPNQLGRERTYANLWPGNWSPRADRVDDAFDAPRVRTSGKRKGKRDDHPAAPTTDVAPVAVAAAVAND